MLVVISPAKTLDYESPLATRKKTTPLFLEQAEELVEQMRDYNPAQIASLMKISDKLASLNVARFADWQRPFDLNNARQAILAFKGDVYTGLEAASFDEADFAFSQKTLRILSGLYGLLRPLDLMQPYRLEMGTKLENAKGKDLYAFWRDTISPALNKALVGHASQVLVNLASTEYFKAVDTKKLNADVITPVFKERKGAQYKVIGLFAKKARGQMSAYIIKNRIESPELIKGFDEDGYTFNEKLSTVSTWVFTRG